MKNSWTIVIVLVLLQLSACSMVSVGYNNADVYLRYSINSYASFNEAQKQIIDDEIDVFMRENRANMLPQYVVLLQQLKLTLQSGKTLAASDVASLRNAVRELYIKTMQPTIVPAARLLSGLEPEQIDELVLSFAKENGKQRDKDLSGSQDEQLRRRAEKTIDFLETLVGGLDDTQLEKARGLSRKLPYTSAMFISQREANQARLIGLMKNKKGEAEIAKLLTAWLVKPESFRNSDEQKLMQEFETGADEMIVSFHDILTERQKQKLLDSINKYLNTFQELARN